MSGSVGLNAKTGYPLVYLILVYLAQAALHNTLVVDLALTLPRKQASKVLN